MTRKEFDIWVTHAKGTKQPGDYLYVICCVLQDTYELMQMQGKKQALYEIDEWEEAGDDTATS